ncbi:hypothetical protein DFO47_101289 [Arthrobacter sp. AG258]|nr:hypothetical protein DFO47_101289 [Arthrobacter sp. AG258]
MRRLRSIPGATFAVGAFLLTVLLGAGAGTASALWQQSATASMAVTASGTWPTPVLPTPACTAGDTANKTIQLSYSGLSEVPTKFTVSAAGSNGTYGSSLDFAGSGGTSGSFVVSGDSVVFSQVSSATATVRVVATFASGAQSTASVKVTLDIGTGNRKVYCA